MPIAYTPRKSKGITLTDPKAIELLRNIQPYMSILDFRKKSILFTIPGIIHSDYTFEKEEDPCKITSMMVVGNDENVVLLVHSDTSYGIYDIKDCSIGGKHVIHNSVLAHHDYSDSAVDDASLRFDPIPNVIYSQSNIYGDCEERVETVTAFVRHDITGNFVIGGQANYSRVDKYSALLISLSNEGDIFTAKILSLSESIEQRDKISDICIRQSDILFLLQTDSISEQFVTVCTSDSIQFNIINSKCFRFTGLETSQAILVSSNLAFLCFKCTTEIILILYNVDTTEIIKSIKIPVIDADVITLYRRSDNRITFAYTYYDQNDEKDKTIVLTLDINLNILESFLAECRADYVYYSVINTTYYLFYRKQLNNYLAELTEEFQPVTVYKYNSDNEFITKKVVRIHGKLYATGLSRRLTTDVFISRINMDDKANITKLISGYRSEYYSSVIIDSDKEVVYLAGYTDSECKGDTNIFITKMNQIKTGTYSSEDCNIKIVDADLILNPESQELITTTYNLTFEEYTPEIVDRQITVSSFVNVDKKVCTYTFSVTSWYATFSDLLTHYNAVVVSDCGPDQNRLYYCTHNPQIFSLSRECSFYDIKGDNIDDITFVTSDSGLFASHSEVVQANIATSQFSATYDFPILSKYPYYHTYYSQFPSILNRFYAYRLRKQALASSSLLGYHDSWIIFQNFLTTPLLRYYYPTNKLSDYSSLIYIGSVSNKHILCDTRGSYIYVTDMYFNLIKQYKIPNAGIVTDGVVNEQLLVTVARNGDQCQLAILDLMTGEFSILKLRGYNDAFYLTDMIVRSDSITRVYIFCYVNSSIKEIFTLNISRATDTIFICDEKVVSFNHGIAEISEYLHQESEVNKVRTVPPNDGEWIIQSDNLSVYRVPYEVKYCELFSHNGKIRLFIPSGILRIDNDTCIIDYNICDYQCSNNYFYYKRENEVIIRSETSLLIYNIDNDSYRYYAVDYKYERQILNLLIYQNTYYVGLGQFPGVFVNVEDINDVKQTNDYSLIDQSNSLYYGNTTYLDGYIFNNLDIDRGVVFKTQNLTIIQLFNRTFFVRDYINNRGFILTIPQSRSFQIYADGSVIWIKTGINSGAIIKIDLSAPDSYSVSNYTYKYNVDIIKPDISTFVVNDNFLYDIILKEDEITTNIESVVTEIVKIRLPETGSIDTDLINISITDIDFIYIKQIDNPNNSLPGIGSSSTALPIYINSNVVRRISRPTIPSPSSDKDLMNKRYGYADITWTSYYYGFWIDYSNKFDFGDGDFTIEFWIKLDEYNDNQTLFYFGNKFRTSFGFHVYINNNGRLYFSIMDNDRNEVTVDFNYQFDLDEWIHVVITRFSNTLMLYINGQRHYEDQFDYYILSSDRSWKFYSGSLWCSSPFVGRMDEIRITRDCRFLDEFVAKPRRYVPDGKCPKNIVLNA